MVRATRTFPSSLDPIAAAGHSPAAGRAGPVGQDRSGIAARPQRAFTHRVKIPLRSPSPPRSRPGRPREGHAVKSADIAHGFTVDGYRIAKRAGPGAGRVTLWSSALDQPGTASASTAISKQDERCKEMQGELVVHPK